MNNPSTTPKTLIILGVALIVTGFSLMPLDLIKLWGVLWAAGTWLAVFGAVFLCVKAAPKEIISFAGLSLAILAAVLLMVAVLFRNDNVHGPVMPIMFALVSLTALSIGVLFVGIIRKFCSDRSGLAL